MIYYLPRSSEEFVDEISRRVDQSGGEFKTVENYIDFVLMELLVEDEQEQAYTPEEEKAIKERLRRIGYIQ